MRLDRDSPQTSVYMVWPDPAVHGPQGCPDSGGAEPWALSVNVWRWR